MGHALFEQVLSHDGVLRNATRVLATNALQYLPRADCVVVVEDGRVAEMGTYDELMSKGLNFASLMAAHGIENEEEGEGVKSSKRGPSIDLKRGPSMDGKRAPSVDGKPAAPTPAPKKGEMGAEEERAVGNVGSAVYLAVFNASGSKLSIPVVVLLFSVEYCSKAFLDFWLSWWASDEWGWESNKYLGVYFAIFLFNGMAIFFRSLIIYFFLVRAANNLHKGLLNRVMKFPMAFFDTTPSGRIINRFSRDTETIDIVLPGIIIQFLGCITSIVTTLAIVCVATGWFTVALPPIMFVYISVQRFYIPACRELQRIESISARPSTAASARRWRVETIRAFRQERTSSASPTSHPHNADALSRRSSPVVAGTACVLGTVIVGCRVPGDPGQGVAGIAGLCLVYALDVTKYLEHGTNMATELETKMNAVERVVEYRDLPLESAHEDDPAVAAGLPLAWPERGTLEVEKLNMRYRPGLPLVLKDLSFVALGGEKLGICGRTGSGKSSLFTALFRIVEPDSGVVRIDGVDVKTLGLHRLRSKMAMIPQDPFMFAGTIRTNLDPFDEHPDVAIWEVLEKVGLRSTVDESPKKLTMEVVDNGANFSLGQRQLLCMGRALLRNSRILMMDEATASVDMDSDALIQKTVRSAFAHCTTLTIAHRLNTIMDSDKVAFLDDGRLTEYGEPAELLKNKAGSFTALVDQSGKKNSKFLASLSEAAAEKRASQVNLVALDK